MNFNTATPEGKSLESTDLAEMLKQTREKMRVLDAALESLGSVREPKERLDRAPVPVQSIPIFNPSTLSY